MRAEFADFVTLDQSAGYRKLIRKVPIGAVLINNYSFIKELLTIDLGNPKMNKMLWKNNMYQSDPEKWDLAVHQGHLRYVTAFKKDNTLVECKMLGKEIPSATYIKYSYFKWALYQAKKLRDR